MLTPEEANEGGALPIRPSLRGAVYEAVGELRDPYVYVEGGDAWLLYTVAGERAIAVARFEAC